MSGLIADGDSGVRIEDLLESREFMSRRRRWIHPERQAFALDRLEKCFPQGEASVFQELVQIAVDSCRADSSGISLEEEDADGQLRFRWVAVAGSFERYRNGTTPRFYSPCGVCLDRGAAQHYQVFDAYYNFLGVTAEPILDGLLIPWRSVLSQGTIWLVSHSSSRAFDLNDYQFMLAVALFVAGKMAGRGGEDRFSRPA